MKEQRSKGHDFSLCQEAARTISCAAAKGSEAGVASETFVLEEAFGVERFGVGPPDVFVEMQLAVGNEDLGAAA